MSTLHSLTKIVTKSAKRRGRGLGSNKGSKSGRGTTRHQKARTTIPLHFEGGQGRLVKKYPLLRGKSKNKSIAKRVIALRLSYIERIATSEPVTLTFLQENKFIPQGVTVKVLFDKALTKPLTIQLPVSASVAKAVSEAGGTIGK